MRKKNILWKNEIQSFYLHSNNTDLYYIYILRNNNKKIEFP